jgi:hypothetical protein
VGQALLPALSNAEGPEFRNPVGDAPAHPFEAPSPPMLLPKATRHPPSRCDWGARKDCSFEQPMLRKNEEADIQGTRLENLY